MWTCLVCRKQLEPSDDFCFHCGSPKGATTKDIPLLVADEGTRTRTATSADAAYRKARSIATQSWVLPIITVLLAAAVVAACGRPNIISGSINLVIILYASTCSLRSLVNVIKYRIKGILVATCIGCVLNGAFLMVLGVSLSALVRGRF